MDKTTLCYIKKDNKYLMLYRNKRKNDINGGKWLGIGGHFLANESAEECLLREVYEETGLTLIDYKFRGIIYFYIDDLKETSYLYTASDFKGDIIDCDEGELHWIAEEEILNLKLWEGDYLFLNKILNDDSYFEMKIVYQNDKLISYKIKE